MGKKRKDESPIEKAPPSMSTRPTEAAADAAAVEPAQTAEVVMRAGRHVAVRVRLRLTPTGIAAIGGLVSSILLSAAVVVRAARRDEQGTPRLPG